MLNKKFIVITSINEPTEAVRHFSKWEGWTTVVVGDRKSPENWSCDGVVYLSLDEQRQQFPEFSNFLPENTYLRKMLGYLYAFKHGAEAIFESDDDNIPYADALSTVDAALNWDQKTGAVLASAHGWVNVYAQFGATDCWPRGFPLEHIKNNHSERKAVAGLPWGVVQFLADEDPDVDAIYRMTHHDPVFFARELVFRLDENAYCPFNSQATLWTPRTFPLMFLPIGKTDRVTDILRGYMSLASLWKSGHTLAYASPVVFQKRNVHNLHRDFVQEIDLYKFSDQWSQELISIDRGSPEEAFSSALNLMIDAGVLPEVNRVAYGLFSNHSNVG